MNRRTELKLRQLVGIAISWIIVGILMTVYDDFVLHTTNSLGPSPEYSFLFSMGMNVGSALMGALMGGSFLVFYVNVKFHDKPYGQTIFAVGVFYIFVIITIIIALGCIAVPLKTGKPFAHPETQQALRKFLMDPSRGKNILSWSVIVAITQLMLQISSKFGQGSFGKIIRGKYNTPKEEKKIFMFLDLNSSTTIAEHLGDEKYHELLKEFFADITNPILDNNGEIYQYVGDEVIVAWNHDEGIRNCQCVKCFFEIKQHIETKKDKYLRLFGVLPTFKAGIHCGKVVAGEIGVIKRDITYSGDVLNTTSRILSMCNEFNAEIISSADLLKELGLDFKFATQPLGSIKLKGKEKEVFLSAVTV
jgi:adenylate cyclase